MLTQFTFDDVESVRTGSVREKTNVFSKKNFKPQEVKGDHQVTDTLDSIETQTNDKVVNTDQIQAHLTSFGTYENENTLKAQIKNSFKGKEPIEGIDLKSAEPLALTTDALQPVSLLSTNQAYSSGQYINPVVVPPEGSVVYKIITPIEPLEVRKAEEESISQPVIHQDLIQKEQVHTITPYIYYDYLHGPILEIRHV